MSFIAAAIIGAGTLGAGAIGAYASEQAANKQIGAEQSAIATEQGMVAPYAQGGQTAENTLLNLLTPQGNGQPGATAQLNNIPGFQFLQNWGLQGVQNASTTRGLGGNVFPAASSFATANAQQTALNTLINPLLSLTQTGAGAAQGGASAIGQSQVGIGNAAAGGITGVAGSATGAINSTTNLSILNALSGGKLFAGMYGSSPSYGGGNAFSGDAYGGNAANPLPGLTSADYG
jgi:hypothetical protein